MIEITNRTDFAVDNAFFLGVAKKILTSENREIRELSIAFVGADAIRQANKQYRKKDKVTDVLSFEEDNAFPGGGAEILICPEAVQENAADQRTPFLQELLKIFVHGVLHVLGYDHEVSKKEEERMFERQDYYCGIFRQ